MRPKRLVLLALACLLAVRTAAASSRLPLQTIDAVGPTNSMHVQFTVAMAGVTCKQLPAQGTQPFTDRFRAQMRVDVINFLQSQGQSQAVQSIKSAGDACADLTYNGKPWASIRAHVWFRKVTNTVYRDTLFNATRERMCQGGYNKKIYATVNKLMLDNNLKVGHNNGSRCPRKKQTAMCTVGWIPYADPNNPACNQASPSPQPSPSPSPPPVVTIYTSTTDVVIAGLEGGCNNPAIPVLHNEILADYSALIRAKIPASALPYTIFYKLPCVVGTRRRSLLADQLPVTLGVGTNSTLPVVADVAVTVGEGSEFKSEVTQSAQSVNATVEDIVVSNVTVSNGTIIPPSPEPSPSPTVPCDKRQLQLYALSKGNLVPIGCADVDGSSNCVGFATLRAGSGSTGGAATGCLQGNVCPDSYGFSWYIAPTSGRQPVLRECWVTNGGNSNCDGVPFSGTNSVIEMAATISQVSASNLGGCTVATAPGGTAFCPERFRFFAATATGALPNPVEGEASCASSNPVCTGKVPVIDSANADALGPVIGCLGTSTQLPAGALCPAQIPQVLSLDASFTLFIAPGTPAGGVVGAASSCRKKVSSSSCGSLTAARQFASSLIDGCFSGNLGQCPASTAYTFPLYGPQPSNSAPVIEQCSTPPTGVTCSGIGGGVYTVAVSNGGLNDVPPPTALDACQKPSTACPAGIGSTGARFPLISNTGFIRACRSVQTPCPIGAIPLCKAAGLIPSDGSCAATDTMGCVDAGAARAIACYSTPANGYPTAVGYPFFAAALNAGTPATLKAVASCFSGASGCTSLAAGNATTTYTITANTGAAFSGCTDTNAPACTSWWSGQVGPAGVCTSP